MLQYGVPDRRFRLHWGLNPCLMSPEYLKPKQPSLRAILPPSTNPILESQLLTIPVGGEAPLPSARGREGTELCRERKVCSMNLVCSWAVSPTLFQTQPQRRMKERAHSSREYSLDCSGRGRKKEGIEKEEEISWPIPSSLCLC